MKPHTPHPPYPRIRKTVKWGGAAVTVLLVVVWVAAEVWSFGWGGPPGSAVSFAGGMLLWGRTYVLEGGREWGIDCIFPVQLWEPVVVALIPTLIAWWPDYRAYRRARMNHCPTCNYDRTGLAAGAVCPECGAGPVGV